MKIKLLAAILATIICTIGTASANPMPDEVIVSVEPDTEADDTTARIQSIVDDLSKPCERLQSKSFWAEATSLATASVALALGGTSFAADGTLELALRLTGVVLSGVSAGASYLGTAYGNEYHERCSASTLLNKAE